MKQVYSTSGSVEAHMIAHMLEQSGITAYIHGEALLSAVGGLPADDLVKIVVADEDFDQARQLILAWEKNNPAKPDSRSLPQTPLRTTIATLIGGILFGMILGWEANDQGLLANPPQKVDFNKDGKPDIIYHYKNKNSLIPESSEGDRNFDGKIDLRTKYDAQGVPIYDTADNDFNGTFETTDIYKNGNLIKSETDTDGDGKADVVTLLENGIVTQVQIMNPKTGKVARIDYYGNLRLQSADVDSDGDGVLDTHFTFDRYEQIIRTEKK